MFYNQSENKYIHEGQQFTLDGVTYPSGWLNQSTPQEKLALGLVEVVKTNQSGNPEFYFVNEVLNGAELTYVNEPKDLKGIRERLWEKIKNRRDEVKNNGGCLVQGKWFHSDSDSKQQQIALVIMGANIPANLQWKTLDGSFATMTQALASELFAAQVMREQVIFGVAESKRAAIANMTIQQLEAYDVLDGFPEEYVDEALIQP